MSSLFVNCGEPPAPDVLERMAGISNSSVGLPGGDVLATLESPPMTDSVKRTFFKAAIREDIANGCGAWLYPVEGAPMRTVVGSADLGGSGGLGVVGAVGVFNLSSEDRLAGGTGGSRDLAFG